MQLDSGLQVLFGVFSASFVQLTCDVVPILILLHIYQGYGCYRSVQLAAEAHATSVISGGASVLERAQKQ